MPSFIVPILAGALLIALSALYRRELSDAVIAVMFLVVPIVLALALVLISSVCYRTYDEPLYRADQWLGIDPFAVIRLEVAHHWLAVSLAIVYYALPVALAMVWVVDRQLELLWASVLAPAIAMLFYLLVPAVGTGNAFTGLSEPHGLIPLGHLSGVPRNCFPSMHLTWAILAAAYSRRRWLSRFSWVFALLTGMAAIGVGGHYFVDLLAAIPFSFAVQSLVSQPSPFASRIAEPQS